MADRPRVFVSRRLVGAGVSRLAQVAEVEVWPEPGPPPYEVLAAEAARSDAIITNIADRVDAAVIAGSPMLKAIANLAVGYDNIDVPAATERGILVTNTPGVLTEATADIAMALILAFARRMPEGDRDVREGRWGIWSPHYLLGRELSGSTIGIVGLGAIGQAVARRAKGFGMRLLYSNRSARPEAEAELGIERVSLDELLQRSDWVSLNIALTPETRHTIGRDQLALMKLDAVLVNAARGGVIDQEALVEALREHRIGGAALDVFAVEPLPADDPLLQLDNVVVTPHLGSATVETRTRMSDLACDNLIAFFTGQTPPAPVNPEVLPKA